MKKLHVKGAYFVFSSPFETISHSRNTFLTEMFLFLFLVQNPIFFFQYTNGKYHGFENFSIVAQSILKSVKNWTSEKP